VHPFTPPPPRALTDGERALLRWLLAQGGDDAHALLPQVEHARVTGGCGCGCATLELAVDGRPPPPPGVSPVTPDFFWNEANGGLCGIFAFASAGTLSGLEVWSVDGETTPSVLPSIHQLHRGAEQPS
jgi:hypothetical protein